MIVYRVEASFLPSTVTIKNPAEQKLSSTVDFFNTYQLDDSLSLDLLVTDSSHFQHFTEICTGIHIPIVKLVAKQITLRGSSFEISTSDYYSQIKFFVLCNHIADAVIVEKQEEIEEYRKKSADAQFCRQLLDFAQCNQNFAWMEKPPNKDIFPNLKKKIEELEKDPFLTVHSKKGIDSDILDKIAELELWIFQTGNFYYRQPLNEIIAFYDATPMPSESIKFKAIKSLWELESQMKNRSLENWIPQYGKEILDRETDSIVLWNRFIEIINHLETSGEHNLEQTIASENYLAEILWNILRKMDRAYFPKILDSLSLKYRLRIILAIQKELEDYRNTVISSEQNEILFADDQLIEEQQYDAYIEKMIDHFSQLEEKEKIKKL